MWIRFVPIDGQFEMPIMRFILLSMFLFKDVDDFAGHMARTPVPQALQRRGCTAEDAASPAPMVDEKKLNEMRGKVQRLQAQHRNLTLDGMWKKSYRAAEWLYDNDKAWLLSALRHHTDAKILATEDRDESYKAEDMELAKRIDQGIDILYEAAGKPKRVGADAIRGIVGKKLQYTKASRERYPLAHGRIVRHIESYWHFSVRRFLFGVAEIRRLQASTVVQNIRLFSGLHANAITALMEHFRWDLETMVAASYDLKGELARLGLSRQWTGPVGIGEIGYGGRKYKKQGAS